jgi:hypothetical protein
MSKLKSLDGLFAGRHFDCDVIILCVRWYLRYKLSLRDLVEMMMSEGCRFLTRRSCVGCSAVRPSSSSAGTISQHLRDGRGGLTRRTRRSGANGFICIGR